MEWMPIETAPKGEPIDLWVTCKRWQGPLAKGRRYSNWIFCDTHHVWRKARDLHYVNSLHADVVPTHWMPLPAPPGEK